MNICLINPSTEHTIIAENPAFIDEERGCNPPLGILYLAAKLQKEGHEVVVIDAPQQRLSAKLLAKAVKDCHPDIIGMTAMTLTMVDVMICARLFKEVLPKAKIVIGGPHPTIYPEETAGLENIDYCIIGEGEEAFVKLASSLANGNPSLTLKGVAFINDKDEFVNGGIADYIEDLDALPFPARELTNYKSYDSILTKNHPVTTMITSRGCPFRCAFCNRPQMGVRFRPRSALNVFREFQECCRIGIKEILVYDDTFTIDKGRVYELCERLTASNLNIPWDIRTRVDTVDEKMLRCLKKSGCRRIHYGVESGSNKVLKELKKGITIEQALQVFTLTKSLGISTLAYFMIGGPSETESDVLQTVKALKTIKADFAHITIFTPFPATELYLQALKEKVIEHDYWREFARNPRQDIKIRYWEQELSRQRMFELLDEAYEAFYGRPGYLIKQLLLIRSWKELRKKVKAGAKILCARRRSA